LTEVVSAVFRVTQNEALRKLAVNFVDNLKSSENFESINIDEELTNKSIAIIKHNPLRGMDNLYIAVTNTYKTKLITLDKEQLKVNKKIAEVYSVKSFLKNF
jgi:predicted nucleic acid-binding protein